MTGFIEELKKRRVVRAGIAYAVAGFVVLQAADLILNGLGAPPIAFKILIIVVLLGFPLVLGLAWAFDLTPDGVQRAAGGKGSAVRGVALVVVGIIIAFVAFAAYGGLNAKEDERERIESIGVLPFVNLSDDKEKEYFSDGMTEELLNVLAKVPGLQVASRTSSFQFKNKSIDVGEAAAKLGVRSILEGSVRHSGNRIRVTAQLIDASNGFHIWSETYDREMKDIFALQDEIAREIVDKLKLELGYQTNAAKRPEDIEAYKLYLQANFHFYKFDESNLRRALELYQRALAIDSTYARAWAGISYTWGYLADEYAAPGDAYPKARAAAQKALALDSTSADAHIALAGLAGWYEWNDAKAEAHARRAVALDPKSAEALLMLSQVLTDTMAATSAIAKAYEIDPLNPNVSASYVTKLRRDGRMDLALQAAQSLVDADPTRARSVIVLANMLRRAGRADEALQHYRRAMELSDTLPSLTTGYAVALNDSGDVAELRRMRDRLVAKSRTRYVREDVVVLYSMFIRDYDHAFEWLDRAVASHGAAAVALRRNPIYKPLHTDPRWANAMRRMQGA